MWLINTLIFVAILSVLIVSHEFGHFIVARRNGIRVEKFAIGFGPVIFKIKRQDTLFLICAVPLGGFVKLAGEDRNSCLGKDDEFFSKPLGVRAKVILAGPLFNYFLAFIIIWFLFMVGMPTFDITLGGVVDDMPAKQAGLKKGDRVIEVNNHNINSWDQLRNEITRSEGKIDITVLRGDKTLTFKIMPQNIEAKDIFGRSVKRRKVGIYPQVVIRRYNPFLAFIKGAEHTLKLTFLIVKGFYYTLTGALPARKALAGPVKLFEITSSVAKEGVLALLQLISVLGISLAIVNLLPIPVLDGGHVFLISLEKIRKKPLSEKAEDILTRIGIAIISVIMFFVIYNDIVNVISHK